MIKMERIRYDLLFPFIKHLSLAGRNSVTRQMMKLSNEEFDEAMLDLRSGKTTLSDF